MLISLIFTASKLAQAGAINELFMHVKYIKYIFYGKNILS